MAIFGQHNIFHFIPTYRSTGGDQAVPVIVYAPNSLGSVDAVTPVGVDTTDVPLVDGVAASLTPDVIANLANQRYVTGIVADNPVFGLDFGSSMDITNLAIGLGTMMPGSIVHIDNMAHLGGFSCGLLFAMPLVPRIGSPRELFKVRRRIAVISMAVVLTLFAFFLRSFEL